MGEEIYHGTLPGHEKKRDKSVIPGILRERRLGPPETVYVKGLYELTL